MDVIEAGGLVGPLQLVGGHRKGALKSVGDEESVVEHPQTNRVLVRGQGVEGNRVFARVVDFAVGDDIVCVALHEACGGVRIGVHQRKAVRAERALRNDIAGKRLASCWVDDVIGLAEENVRPQQFGEIPLPHQLRRHCGGVGRQGAIAKPLLAEQEEEPVAFAIEIAGNINRAIHAIAELVVPQRLGQRILERVGREVARPGIGVHGAIAEVFEDVPVEIAAAALGYHAHLAA